MDIIRIPTHYAMQITYMSESDKAYVLDSIMRLSIGEIIDIEKSMRGGIVLSIWTEAVQLENKACVKKGKPLKVDIAPMVPPMVHQKNNYVAPNPNQTNSNQVKPIQNTVSIDTVQAPIESFGKEELNLMQEFLRKSVGVDKFKDTKERWYVQHCYSLLRKIGREEFTFRMTEILSDPFKAKNSNKLAYLYGELKSFIHSPIVTPLQKSSSLDITL